MVKGKSFFQQFFFCSSDRLIVRATDLFAALSVQVRDASLVMEVVAPAAGTTVAVMTKGTWNAQITMPVVVSTHHYTLPIICANNGLYL